MPRPDLRFHDDGFAEDAAFDTAVSRALLTRVGEGVLGETLRLHRPGDVVAFSPLDATRPELGAAVAAARAVGFDAVRRLAGGRAAVFHTETLAFSWCVPARDLREGIRERFERTAGLTARALGRLGVDARVGEVPGEYCPGEYSVNARGACKIMGVGQRVVRGAAHVGGVIVVRDSHRVREALVPVYDALGLAWDPDTAGSIADEIGAVDRGDVVAALRAELEVDYCIEPAPIDAESLALARSLAPDHRIPDGVRAA